MQGHTVGERPADFTVISSTYADPHRKQLAKEGPNGDPLVTLWSSTLLP